MIGTLHHICHKYFQHLSTFPIIAVAFCCKDNEAQRPVKPAILLSCGVILNYSNSFYVSELM